MPVLESSAEIPVAGVLSPLYGRASDWKKVEEVERAGPLRGAFTVTPVLCYEALFPGLVARRRPADSVAILNLSDDGWVAGDDATRQLTAFATFRAIEQRLTFIRVAHGGLSVVVDPFGRTLHTLPMDAYASARVRVQATPPPTAFERVALLLLLAAAALLAGCAVRRRSRVDSLDLNQVPAGGRRSS